MPKKRQSNLKHLAGTSQSKHHASISAKSGKIASVNARLYELRLAEPAEANQKKRDIADSVAGPSVPPGLNNILGVPTSAPPQARPGTRLRAFNRVPGPAPPSSWARSSRNGRVTIGSRVLIGAGQSHRGEKLDLHLRFQRMVHEDQVLNGKHEGSLSHMCLKLLATSVRSISEADYDVLLDLPFQVRMQLLSYLALCEADLSTKLLTTLLEGPEPIQELNLSGLVGHADLTVSRLTNVIKNDLRKQKSEDTDTVAESWDAGAKDSPSLISPKYRFANLTHLSFSHPSPTVLWRDLLALTKQTPRLTHLSLAYWPRPTLTPNLATTTIKNDRGPDVAAGGSHFYSELDQDLAEPISLLRQLSSHLPDLDWLDVEGCDSWTDAFYKLLPSTSTRNGREWNHSAPQPLLLSSMRNVKYIRMAKDELPTDKMTILTPGLVIVPSWDDRSKMNAMLEMIERLGSAHDSRAEAVSQWCRRALRYHRNAAAIRTLRRDQSCGALTLDYGWTRITV